MRFLGIDPGKGGGLAVIDAERRVKLIVKMPETEMDLLDWLDEAQSGDDVTAALELVRSSPQMGVVSAFSFGRNYGSLRTALLAASISFEEVTPAKWQGLLRCRSAGDKNVTKRRAQELFPGVKVTHAVADALLLAEWRRQTWVAGV